MRSNAISNLIGILLSFTSAGNLSAVNGAWILNPPGEERLVLQKDTEGIITAEIAFPGSAQLYLEPERATFRPGRDAFDAAQLELEIKLEDKATSTDPIRAMLFFKDKDGRWFQTIEEFEVIPDGQWHKLSSRLDQSGRNWRGVGHAARFDATAASNLFSAGVSLYDAHARRITASVRNLKRTGTRETAPLAVLDWELPDIGPVNARVNSRFDLTREYFNPFDPGEIRVDFELKTPDGTTARYPAFYSRDYIRKQHHIRETLTPVGPGFWELRFTPQTPGEHQVRLVIEDPREKEPLITRWRKFQAEPSDLPGAIRVSRQAPTFFEHTTGEFFFPVALNIHTNTDRRSELGFKFGPLPDRGTFDYDDYLNSCGENGITAVEVWMAGWTMALEHDATRAGYHGVGRYNLESAWKLDYLFELARRNNIYLNLVIDNHGRLSNTSDPEWSENPINSRGRFARANGGFLEHPADFFRNAEARKNNERRNRYIAARWGADPNLMAVELWSEVDLTDSAQERYNDNSLVDWAREMAANLTRDSQLKAPVSIHICSDFQRLLGFRRLFEQPTITHYAGDAYRDPKIHFADHLRAYERTMRNPKPQLITEYGGNPNGAVDSQVLGDLHIGLWGSLFSRLAGTPFLWWHDFVHLRHHYDHYKGFSRYLKGIDLRTPGLLYLNPEVTAPSNGKKYEAMAVSTPVAAYGWLFCREAMHSYPDSPDAFPEVKGVTVKLPGARLTPGDYRLRWFATLSGTELSSTTVRIAPESVPELTAPIFRLDLAFKLEKITEPEKK